GVLLVGNTGWTHMVPPRPRYRDLEASRQRWVPSTTAACTARARRAPQVERGPPYGSSAPASATGQAITSASVAVPVAAMPDSASACTFASVAVATAFTSAASASGTGRNATMLMVPTVAASASSAGAAARVG